MSRTEIYIKKILAAIRETTGFNAEGYRSSTLRRRLDWRLSITNSKDYKDYLAYLRANPSECYKFMDALFIKVSDFFRDRSVFSYLKKVTLPDLLERIAATKSKKLSIWSIACSRGQEPYSLAMILDDIMKRKKEKIKISIQATDVSKVSLKQGKLAQYEKAELKNIPSNYIRKYFRKTKNNKYKVTEQIRRMVKFNHHDFIQGNILGKFHLISCRNLLIFFNLHQQSEVFKKIHSSLLKHGILVLGKSETPKDEKLFQCLSPKNHVYQKARPRI